MLINKIDLLPHVDFDMSRAIANAAEVNPDMSVLRLSARTGEGMQSGTIGCAAGQGGGRSSLRIDQGCLRPGLDRGSLR